MVPLGEEVHSFDLHFQDASVGVASGRGVVMGGVKGCSLQTSGLRHDTQYLFRARSVNALGHGAWSTAYRVSAHSPLRRFHGDSLVCQQRAWQQNDS